MAINVLDVALANGYTKATAAGMGAIKGDKGEKGDPGPKGDPGVDYILTDPDKEEIADIVLDELPNAEEVEV